MRNSMETPHNKLIEDLQPTPQWMIKAKYPALLQVVLASNSWESKYPMLEKLVSDLLATREAQMIEAVEKTRAKLTGGHRFEAGYNKCKYCFEPRIIVDRVRHIVLEDKISGGEIVEVTEKTIDITNLPCPNNPARLTALAALDEVEAQLRPQQQEEVSN